MSPEDTVSMNTDGNSPDFRIREAVPGDLPALSAIEQRCFTDPWSERLIRDCLENDSLYRMYAAEDESGIVGYGVLSMVADEAGVDNLAVLPEARRQGIGAALLSRMIFEAGIHGMTWVFLEVRESNAPAIALYERAGFVEVGFRRNYYQNPEEGAKLYTLTLSETE